MAATLALLEMDEQPGRGMRWLEFGSALRCNLEAGKGNAHCIEIARNLHAEGLRAKAEKLRKLADQYAAEAEHHDGRTLTVNEAMQRYKAYMQEEKGNKQLNVSTTMHRLRGLFADCSVSLHSITERKAAEVY